MHLELEFSVIGFLVQAVVALRGVTFRAGDKHGQTRVQNKQKGPGFIYQD